MRIYFQRQLFEIEDTENDNIYFLYQRGNIGVIDKKNISEDVILATSKLGKIKEALSSIETNKAYSLWKDGRLYYVHCLAVNSSDEDVYVIYQALYGDYKYYARKSTMFTEEIKGRGNENKTGQKYRFELLK